MVQIDKPTAVDWVERLNAANARFVNETAEENFVDFRHLVAVMTLHFYDSLRHLHPDDLEAGAVLVEHAAMGMSHGLVTSLYWQKPPVELSTHERTQLS